MKGKDEPGCMRCGPTGEMRIMKRILALILAVLLCTGIAAAGQATSILELPEDLTVIEAEAFCGSSSIGRVELPEGIVEIRSRAFADSSLTEISLPESLTYIAEDAFDGCNDYTVEVVVDSYAYYWAAENGFFDLPEPSAEPSAAPTADPTADPTDGPTVGPSVDPTIGPSVEPTAGPDAGPTEEPEGVAYRALLIGNTYHGTDSELLACDDDAEGIAKMLARQAGTPFDVTTRLNCTASEMQSAISSAFADADSNDVSLFYFSGHGVKSDSTALLGALGGIGNTCLTPAQLRTSLDAIPGRKIVLLDCCHSGAHIGKSAGSAAAFNSAIISAFSSNPRGRLTSEDYSVLTACSQTETSWSVIYEDSDIGYSLFTAGIAAGSGYDLAERENCAMHADNNGDGNGETTLGEAFSYAANLVKEMTADTGEAQNVQYYGDMERVLWAYGETSD